MAYLIGAGSADFATLKAKLDTTDGNLSVHLRKLEEAGYVAVTKSFRERKPLT
jgi:DNA-binding MarR family transcriptional regulator